MAGVGGGRRCSRVGAMANIVLINPRFEMSFWGMEKTLPFLGKRANIPVAALPLLAALTPDAHHVTIIDENVEPIDFELCARADIVGVTGMIVQRHRMKEILTELKKRECYTVVGGAWITVSEDYFTGLADVVFVGEAEETWPQFLADWSKGCVASRYEQAEKTDMSKVPAPRLDLLKMKRYAFGSLQFSRGCPFQCEFCDIIVVFGRRPRLKTSAQITAELDQLLRFKVPIVFIVDDNLIGNKKEIRPLLKSVIEWQKRNRYPFAFLTEASIDLADDPELMQLTAEANICGVFVGIESTSEDSLRETRKLQNVRRGGTLVEKVRRIEDAGMEVFAGMIVGFDNDDESVFSTHARFLAEARVSVAMVSMLSAIPKTPLFKKLAAENRLDPTDHPVYGTNVEPRQMSREKLRDGYAQLMAELYEPKAFFDRADAFYINGGARLDRGWQDFHENRPWLRRLRQVRVWAEAFGLFAIVMWQVSDKILRKEYWNRFRNLFRTRRSPLLVRAYALKCATHYHLYEFSRVLQLRDRPVTNTF